MALLRNTELWQACKVLALPAITLAVAFCNSEGGSGASASSSGAGGSGGAPVSSTAAIIDPVTATAGSGVGGQGGGPEIPVADAGIPDGLVPPDPVVACGSDADAGDGGVCPLPPPTCAGSEWIVYYKNPECVSGLCHFEAFAYPCDAPSECINGGCEYNFTF